MIPVSFSLAVSPLLFESAVNAFRPFQLGQAFDAHLQSACITLDIGLVCLIVDTVNKRKQNDVEEFPESQFVLMSAMKGWLQVLLACQPGAECQ
ncbi:hypothetical protein D0861_03803 [Hortaea werneckii]|uniref:Uncharacterized protein n=1 Tax=Hortaea werneckii TaxID=91943 RepID=A0A3M7FMV4_HORWE|nr:hypothetical protein D0861_03803 [Hortaea werneckii]